MPLALDLWHGVGRIFNFQLSTLNSKSPLKMEELFRQAILQIAKETKVTVSSGTVAEVREYDCDVNRGKELPELLGVRFHAIAEEPDSFIRVVPKKGSTVLCAMIENDISEAVVIATSQVENIMIKVNKAEFSLHDGKFTVKNDKADLKQIGLDTLTQLSKATILTPAGPGKFSAPDLQAFETQKQNLNKLFH